MNHEDAHQLLRASHPRMAELIARSRRYNITPAVSIRPFDALAESIAYQQLSGKAAATIFGRVRALYPKAKWLDPVKVLATADEKLRAAGLSSAKTAPIKDLAAKTIDEAVPTGRAILRISDDEIIVRITKSKRLRELQARRGLVATLVTLHLTLHFVRRFIRTSAYGHDPR